MPCDIFNELRLCILVRDMIIMYIEHIGAAVDYRARMGELSRALLQMYLFVCLTL